jgi:hypothetical protein
LEYKLISSHCVDCYYFGKTCAFGKGRISSLFFKKGEKAKFNQKTMCWKDIIPDFLASGIPTIVGIIILTIKFNWLILISIVLIFLLTFLGNALVRRRFSCNYCKQLELGCPAQKLFEKTK